MARRPDRKVRPFASELMEAAVLTEAVLWTVFVSNAGAVAAFPWLAFQAAARGALAHWAGEPRLQPDQPMASSQIAEFQEVGRNPGPGVLRPLDRAAPKRSSEYKRAA